MPKRSGRVAGGLDDMIISLYGHGTSVRDILHHLEQVYGTQLSHETVSRITDGVLEEVRAWQTRPLDPAYAVVFPAAIWAGSATPRRAEQGRLPRRRDRADGEKHVLGIWMAKTAPGDGAAGEGAGFWRSVTADLKNRGVRDILIACCDGLTGFDDAITSVFERTVVQRYVVHLVRNALRPVACRAAPSPSTPNSSLRCWPSPGSASPGPPGRSSPSELEALLAAPDLTTWEGRRDRALILLGAQTGLRVSEIIGLNCGDVCVGVGGHVRCEGKGRKQRVVPLTGPVRAVLREWARERGGRAKDPLFSTRTGRRLSGDAVERRVSTHTAAATQQQPSLHDKRVSPHVLRHSVAMSLLHAGIDTSVIALWLGHADIRATSVYLHADMTIKERALALTTPASFRPGRYRPPDALLAFLESL